MKVRDDEGVAIRIGAPVAEFMANHVVGVKMRHFPFGEDKAALAWLRAA
jgi:hypothetical protein